MSNTRARVAAMNPSMAVLAKLGSIIVHIEEAASTQGHAFDWKAAYVLLADDEVQRWLDGMRKLALLPVKRREDQP